MLESLSIHPTNCVRKVSGLLCSGLELIFLQELAEIQMHSDAAKCLTNLDWGKTQAHYKNRF